jgi:hypothetical protein
MKPDAQLLPASWLGKKHTAASQQGSCMQAESGWHAADKGEYKWYARPARAASLLLYHAIASIFLSSNRKDIGRPCTALHNWWWC